MSIRFRRSVRICKGLRINFSASGVSYTVGMRGASLTMGKRGTYLNTGIPGTGISSRERIDRPERVTKSNQSSLPTTTLTILVSDRGDVKFTSEDGTEITDPTMIRRIKATSQYKAQKEQLESVRQEKVKATLEKEEQDAFAFLNLQREAPLVTPARVFQDRLDRLTLEKYQRKTFSADPPDDTHIRQDLENEALWQVKPIAFWKRKELRAQYVEERLPQRIKDAHDAWEKSKKDFEQAEDVVEAQTNKEYEQDYTQEKTALENAIAGDSDFISQVIDRWIGDCTLPVEIHINYTYEPANGTLWMDLDLPEIEDIPETKSVQLKSGKISEKNKTQGQLKTEYSTLVFGLLLFLSSNIFNLSPAIRKIIISGYTQRRDTAGNLNDDYIISIKFPREPFETTDVREVDPCSFCMQFENRCRMTTTMLFKPIEPFQE